MAIDRQNLPRTDRLIPNCKVADLGDVGTIPRFVTVELPERDGPRVLARYNGFPEIAVDDSVTLQRVGANNELRIHGTDGPTATEAGSSGHCDKHLIDKDLTVETGETCIRGGPVILAAGVTITVQSGARFKVI